MRAPITVLLSLPLLLVACESRLGPDEVEITCSSNPEISTTLSAPGPGQTVAGDLLLVGSAEHGEGLTIRTLSVLGVQATNKGFNFDSWQVTVPLATLLAHADAVTVDGREVVLTLEATQACDHGRTIPVTIESESEAAGKLYVDPPVRLGALTAEVTYVNDEGEALAAEYLPAHGETSALLEIGVRPGGGALTDKELSGGARVQLDAPGVLFAGIPDRVARRLSDQAELKIAVRSGQPGTTAIVVRGGDDSVGANLRVGGEPLLTPSALVLGAGDSAVVHGSVAGDVPATVLCTASASPSATVKSFAGDDLADGAEFSLALGDSFGFTVEVADPVTPGVVVVTCEEQAYNQTGKELVVILE